MVIAPCSVRTMSEIATGVTTTLLTRAADVALKERRRLVLMVRETPPAHRASAHDAGAVRDGRDHRPSGAGVLCRPASLEDMVDQTIGRVLDLFGIDVGLMARWKDPA